MNNPNIIFNLETEKEVLNKRLKYLNDLKARSVNGEVELDSGSIIEESFIDKEIQKVVEEWESIQN